MKTLPRVASEMALHVLAYGSGIELLAAGFDNRNVRGFLAGRWRFSALPALTFLLAGAEAGRETHRPLHRPEGQ